MADVLRAPVVSIYPGRKSQPAEIWPNLLLNTLALVAAAPLRNPAFDNSRQLRLSQAQIEPISMPLLLRQTPAQLLPLGTNGYDEWAQPRLIYRPQDTQPQNVLIRDLAPLALPFVSIPDFAHARLVYRPQDTNIGDSLVRILAANALPFVAGPDILQWRAIQRPQDTNPPNVLLGVSAPAQLLPIGANGYDEWAQPRLTYRPQDTNSGNLLIRDLVPAQLLPVGTNGDDLTQIARRSVVQTDVQPNLLTNTLAPSQSLQLAGNLLDWTQPIWRRGAQDTTPFGNLLSSTLGLTPGPFIPADTAQCNLSIRPQDTQTSNAVLLRGPVQLLPVGTNGYDELCQPRLRVGAQADGQSNLLTSTLAVVATATVVQPFDFTQPVKGRFAQADATPNTLIRVLIPAQLLPIGTNSDDFTQPSRRVQSQSDSAANLLLNTLSAAPQVLPAGQILDGLQWRKSVSPQDTSYVNLLSGTLSLTPGPFVPVDTAQWGFATRAQDTQFQNGTLLRLVIAQAAPFASVDTAQRARPFAPQDTTAPQSILYQVQVSAPIRSIDTTQGMRRPGAQADASSNLLTSTLRVVGPLPFVAADWTIIPSKRPGPQDTNVGNWIFQNAPPPVALATVPTVRFVLADYPQRIVLTGSATLIAMN